MVESFNYNHMVIAGGIHRPTGKHLYRAVSIRIRRREKICTVQCFICSKVPVREKNSLKRKNCRAADSGNKIPPDEIGFLVAVTGVNNILRACIGGFSIDNCNFTVGPPIHASQVMPEGDNRIGRNNLDPFFSESGRLTVKEFSGPHGIKEKSAFHSTLCSPYHNRTYHSADIVIFKNIELKVDMMKGLIYILNQSENEFFRVINELNIVVSHCIHAAGSYNNFRSFLFS